MSLMYFFKKRESKESINVLNEFKYLFSFCVKLNLKIYTGILRKNCNKISEGIENVGIHLIVHCNRHRAPKEKELRGNKESVWFAATVYQRANYIQNSRA